MLSCSNSNRPGRHQSRLALRRRPLRTYLCGRGFDLKLRWYVDVGINPARQAEKRCGLLKLLGGEPHLFGDLLRREFALPEMPKLPLLVSCQGLV